VTRMRRALLLAIPIVLAILWASTAADSVRGSDAGPVPAASLIRLETSPAGLLVEVNGTPAVAPHSFSCDPGTNRTIDAPSPQLNGSTRYVFGSWSDGGSRTHTVSCDTPANLTAVFTTEYEILVNTTPRGRFVLIEGTPMMAPVIVWCPAGSSRLVDALLQEQGRIRYTPSNWSDGGAITHRVGCNMPRALLLAFAVDYLIGLFSSPVQNLQIFVDGDRFLTPAEFACREGTTHVLAVPQTQTDSFNGTFRFEAWSDGGPATRTIGCTEAFNYTAIFAHIEGPGPPGGPSPTPWNAIAAMVLLLVGLVVVLPVLLLRRSDRKRPPATETLPVPTALASHTGPRACPNCVSPAEQDWTYCMKCGASLR